MSADPKEPPTAAEPGPAAEEQLFPLLNDCWEALRRGGPTARQPGPEPPPGGGVDPVELQVLAALNAAREALAEDSRLPTPEVWAAEAAELLARPLLQPGTRLGVCRVRGLLGWGGMGEVYLAEHEPLGRLVALKVLPAHLAGDAAAAERFRHSGRILARLSHPNLAAAYDANTHEGRLYLVMEYVPGQDLRVRVRQAGPLAVAEACGLIRQTAAGVAYLHGQGVVHRDIKPSNLMRTPDGTVKILDLGLARLRAAGAGEGEAELTASGVPLGTPKYMAPEQGRDARRADARSDLYSLGCTFYYLLTGRAPFEEDTPAAQYRAHANQSPPPVRELRPEVPAGLAAVLDRLLAKEPGARFASAAEVVAALQPFTEGGERARSAAAAPALPPAPGPAPVGSPPAVTVPAARPRRRRLAAAAALAVAAGVVALHHAGRPGTPLPPLKGTLDVRIWDEHDRLRKGRRLNQQGALPLGPGDLARVEARLNRPAYVYLLQIDPGGRVTPLYPWAGGDWGRRPADEGPVARLDLPDDPGEGWVAQPGESGMETLVLLARDTRLPRDVDALLAGLSDELPPQRAQHFQAAVWFENGDMVRDEPERAFAHFTRTIDDPVLRSQALLKNKLQKYFPYSLAVSYAFQGKGP
jgi:hypothetical protein